ncbi:hypothetical protein Tco_1259876, partial [Tanacetum coccineum]
EPFHDAFGAPSSGFWKILACKSAGSWKLEVGSWKLEVGSWENMELLTVSPPLITHKQVGKWKYHEGLREPRSGGLGESNHMIAISRERE